MKTLIINANTRTLDQIAPTLPNMRDALNEWFQNIVFTMVKKMTTNFELVETNTQIQFQGVVENIKPQDLDMRPEGQRKWRYISVWATPELELNPDEIFTYQGINYRVMTKNDWSSYGYVEYECAEDYS